MAKVSLVVLLFHLAAAYHPAPVWRTDSQTGKQYAVVYNPRRLDYETSSAICGTISGKLVEPRDQHENQFIYQLVGDNRIYLGMKDSELNGQWVWQSDKTNVSWFNWQTWNGTDKTYPEPDGKYSNNNESCVMIIGSSYAYAYSGYNRSTWADIRCSVNCERVVCEKQTYCPDKFFQCFTDHGVRSSIAPNIIHMCTVRHEIERCIDDVVCSSSRQQQAWKDYYRQVLVEVCSITTVNWTVWETTETKTCVNDNDLEIDTFNQLRKCYVQHPTCPCQGMVTDICSALNARNACRVNEMSRVCADGSAYIDFMKEYERAVTRASIATLYRRVTEPPHNCTLTVA